MEESATVTRKTIAMTDTRYGKVLKKIYLKTELSIFFPKVCRVLCIFRLFTVSSRKNPFD